MAKVLTADFHEGQRVEANHMLVRLDTRDLVAKHKQATAGESAANAALEVAETNLRRMRSLVDAGAASQTQFEAVEVATAQARAASKTARAAIDGDPDDFQASSHWLFRATGGLFHPVKAFDSAYPGSRDVGGDGR
jgi:multidrug efflux pump subunit AcrA (membrane-fusion protein)